MKRVQKIVADSNDVKVSIRIDVQSRNGLTTFEVNKVMSSLVRGVADALPEVPFTDFGIDNTRIVRS